MVKETIPEPNKKKKSLGLGISPPTKKEIKRSARRMSAWEAFRKGRI